MTEQEFVDSNMEELDARIRAHLHDFRSRVDAIFQLADVKLGYITGETRRRNPPYDNMSWSDRGELNSLMRVDVAERTADLPFSNHRWLQDLLDSKATETPRTGRRDIV